jgi:hypothetical protein
VTEVEELVVSERPHISNTVLSKPVPLAAVRDLDVRADGVPLVGVVVLPGWHRESASDRIGEHGAIVRRSLRSSMNTGECHVKLAREKHVLGDESLPVAESVRDSSGDDCRYIRALVEYTSVQNADKQKRAMHYLPSKAPMQS